MNAIAKKLGLRLFRTSALEDHNVDEVFESLTEQYLDVISRTTPVIAPLPKGKQILTRLILFILAASLKNFGTS